ncbi:MAG: helix-turn-helix transcriptional regulator [Cyclobacteriaceae bacterium]|nr:helix-turn-helix transcriptional regulator [Cytophagales bacterium]MCZ8328247.1 helix-turn-helix transcriptional regulator [Cyclobacteriaceae bacterium]
MPKSRDKEYIKKFGSHLRRIRIVKKLSQEELAFRCGFPLSQIGRFERGERSPSISSLRTLARALKLHMRDLFDFD